MANVPYVIGQIVELDATRNSEDGPGPYQVLQTFQANNGGEYIYLRLNTQPAAGIPKGRFVSYKTNGSVQALSSASGTESWPLAMSKNAMSAGQYGFFCIKGKENVVTGSSGYEVGKPLFLGQQAATLTTATTSAGYVTGIAFSSNIAASTTAGVLLNYPCVRWYGPQTPA